MFIIDFDGTLYSTHLLVEEIFRVLASYNVPLDAAKSTMKTAIIVGDDLHYNYSYERQIAVLVEKGYEFDEDALLADLFAITEEYDFADTNAALFLTKLKAFRKPILLLSAGNEAFQKMKLHSTSLSQYFDEVVIVTGDKDAYVAGLAKRGKAIYFINDKVPENEAVKNRCPEAIVITKHNPHKLVGKGEGTLDLPTFDSLLEIADYVEHTSK